MLPAASASKVMAAVANQVLEKIEAAENEADAVVVVLVDEVVPDQGQPPQDEVAPDGLSAATVPIPEDPEDHEEAEPECIGLRVDAEEIIVVRSPQQDILNMLARVMGLNQESIDSMNTLLRNRDTDRLRFYPKEQCLVAPRMESENVVRVLGHYRAGTERKGPMKLMVSSYPLEALTKMVPDEECPMRICETLPDGDCMMVTAERASPRFTAMTDARNGLGQTAVFLIPNVEGTKIIMSDAVGFEAFSMFRAVIRSQRVPDQMKPLSLSVVPQRKEGQMDMVVLGGRSFQNVLLQQTCGGKQSVRASVNPLVGDDVRIPVFPRRLKQRVSGRDGAGKVVRDESKVNVVMKVKEGKGVRVRLNLIPLIYDDEELRAKEMKECIVDRHHVNGCSVYVRSDLDYDVRVENIGDVMADFELFAVDVPMNGMEHGAELRGLEFGDGGHRGVWSSGCHVAMYWGIGVLIVALFAVFMNRRNRKRRRRVMAAPLHAVDVTLAEPDAYTMM